MSETNMDIYEIVKRLIGPINPTGESNADNDKLENLKVMTELIAQLLVDVDYVAYRYKNNHQLSMKKASVFASDFQDSIGIVE